MWIGFCCFFFQAEDGIRYLVRSRGLGDVYKRQHARRVQTRDLDGWTAVGERHPARIRDQPDRRSEDCLLYTSDAADERSSVDLGGRRIIKKKKNCSHISPERAFSNGSRIYALTTVDYST